MKIKKLIATLALSATILSGFSTTIFAADSKTSGLPADSETKAVQASILKEAILKAETLNESPLKSSLSLKAANGREVYWTQTGPVSSGTSLNSNGHDLWTRGLQEGSNNYYFGYSYYYNSESSHYSTATLNNSSTIRGNALPGDTSVANSNSFQSPFNYRVTAGLM